MEFSPHTRFPRFLALGDSPAFENPENRPTCDVLLDHNIVSIADHLGDVGDLDPHDSYLEMTPGYYLLL